MCTVLEIVSDSFHCSDKGSGHMGFSPPHTSPPGEYRDSCTGSERSSGPHNFRRSHTGRPRSCRGSDLQSTKLEYFIYFSKAILNCETGITWQRHTPTAVAQTWTNYSHHTLLVCLYEKISHSRHWMLTGCIVEPLGRPRALWVSGAIFCH